MMYSATLLASLLASAHGFAATPKGGLKCSANEEKYFVYSVDPSMLYPFVASIEGGPDVTSDVTVTKGLVGNTWQGLQLSITQGDTTITQAGGKPLTVTSPNTLESGGFNVVSEDFCLGYGNWTVRMGAPTHPEMASYNASADNLTMEERRAVGAPINAVPVTQAVGKWFLDTFNIDLNNFNGQVYTPFAIRWAIFPAEMRADAEAAAATGAVGMLFIEDNVSPAWAVYQVDYEEGKVVPGPVYLARPSHPDVAVPPPSVDIPQPCYSALALDIDGTITTADARVVYGLVQEARLAGSHVAINTARTQPYCDEPEWGLTTHLVAREHHYCGAAWTRNLAGMIVLPNVPKFKVANMDRIAASCNVPRACALLVDDLPENIVAVERAGYVGVLVDEQTGITPRIAKNIMDRLKECAQAE